MSLRKTELVQVRLINYSCKFSLTRFAHWFIRAHLINNLSFAPHRCSVDSSQQLNNTRLRFLRLESESKQREQQIQRLQSDLKSSQIDELRLQTEAYFAEIQRLQNLIPTYVFHKLISVNIKNLHFSHNFFVISDPFCTNISQTTTARGYSIDTGTKWCGGSSSSRHGKRRRVASIRTACVGAHPQRLHRRRQRHRRAAALERADAGGHHPASPLAEFADLPAQRREESRARRMPEAARRGRPLQRRVERSHCHSAYAYHKHQNSHLHFDQ